MIIQSGAVGMSSARNYQSKQMSFTAAQIWETSAREKMMGIGEQQENNEDQTKTKGEGKFDDLMERYKSTQNLKPVSLQERLDTVNKIRRQTLDYLLYILFGKKVEEGKYATNENGEQVSTTNNESEGDFATSLSEQLPQNVSMRGSVYQYNYFCEQETTSFSTTGKVVTSDGRTIDFNVELEMTRSFMEISETQIDFGTNMFKDPLVINLDCNAADVKDQKFLFDIDADGELDSVSMLGPGSGYLALDLNEDGVINDGGELFGTRSGNGFADLAKYDSDGNGWIDEADDIFSKLKVWCMDESGKGTLIDLKTAGVGALYLGSADTNFSLNDAYNQSNAVIRRTGFFLYENGGTGTIQQLDLAT